MINDFHGSNFFLSNFFPVEDTTSEHLYQLEKTLNPEWRRKIREAKTPAEAKNLGRQAPIAPDWDVNKLGIMRNILEWKFSKPKLREMLLSTGDQELIEGNTWHDNFWGDCSCNRCRGIIGQNHLGRLLMEIRRKL